MTVVFRPPVGKLERPRVAVSGHRRNRLSDETCTQIELRLGEVLACLERAAAGPGTLVTGMADGADLAAVRAMPKGWNAVGVLATSVSVWTAGLSNISSKDARTFCNIAATSELLCIDSQIPDYMEVGHRILSDADCLIAVWNEKPGLPGGTAHVVEMAAALGLPTAIIPV